jgi:hypothetical protein
MGASDERPPAWPAEVIGERLPRIAWLAQEAVVAQAEALEVTCRLADLGWVGPLVGAARSTLPHVAELQDRLAALEARADRAWGEVRRLGGLVVDRELGAVDLPAFVDGREVALCWQLGESTLSYWHDRGERCDARRPLDSPIG